MIWKSRSCGDTDAESTARKQLGGCRVASSEADKLGRVPDPFTETSPQDCLVLGSCGKVAHDQKISRSGCWRRVATAGSQQEESWVPRPGQVRAPAASSQTEPRPRQGLVQEEARRDRNPPRLTRLGFERDLLSPRCQQSQRPTFHWRERAWFPLGLSRRYLRCLLPRLPLAQPGRLLVFVLKAEQFLWERLSQP